MLCVFGCCYHLTTEQHYSHPLKEEKVPPVVEQKKGFPLSTFLSDRPSSAQAVWLGRHARMLANQPLHRMAVSQELPTKSLLWRAELQVGVSNSKSQNEE